ncbi:uncharacterized protein TRIVIDRAFT_226200 [Trichoderma virens Gv29-8]|uniref:Uncharacterized protein n=1 Tax=Hypocrea virens (strain Gv29-8 / FGSC 10586) TaxID=413071 RepID=G9N5P2_HYPVG|nr:uncharacterized protein TRIVIDRAFT_226200 [Trichoderma virens Gv29-8]EHK18084.1 hypothetical protein TRIVIDRAFT_226200 [Trichoderma virens Gv29-8]UKZ54048.1 hypothetical protein TrVGV298_007853 [Trichoderma virens]
MPWVKYDGLVQWHSWSSVWCPEAKSWAHSHQKKKPAPVPDGASQAGSKAKFLKPAPRRSRPSQLHDAPALLLLAGLQYQHSKRKVACLYELQCSAAQRSARIKGNVRLASTIKDQHAPVRVNQDTALGLLSSRLPAILKTNTHTEAETDGPLGSKSLQKGSLCLSPAQGPSGRLTEGWAGSPRQLQQFLT